MRPRRATGESSGSGSGSGAAARSRSIRARRASAATSVGEQRRAGRLRGGRGGAQRLGGGGAVARGDVRLGGAVAGVDRGDRERDRVERRARSPPTAPGRRARRRAACGGAAARRPPSRPRRTPRRSAGAPRRARAGASATLVEHRLVGLAERLRAAGRLGLDALRHPRHAHQPRRLVGVLDPRRRALQQRARVVEPVLAHGQLDLHVGPRLDPLRLGGGLAERGAARRAPRAARRGRRSAARSGRACRARRCRCRRRPRPARARGSRSRASSSRPSRTSRFAPWIARNASKLVRSGRLRASASSACDDGERLLGVPGEVEHLGQVDRRARRGPTASRSRSRARSASRSVAMPSSSSPSPARVKPSVIERAHLGQLGADRARLGERRLDRALRASAKSPSSISTRARSSSTRARSALWPGRQQRDGAVERGEAVAALAGLAQEVARAAGRAPAARSGSAPLVERLDRLADQRDGARRLAARAGAGRRVAQRLGVVHAGALRARRARGPRARARARTGAAATS